MSKNIILSVLIIISLFYSCTEQPVSNSSSNPDGLRSVSFNSSQIFSGPISEMPYYENYVRDCNRTANTGKDKVPAAKAEAKIAFTEAKVFVVNQTNIYKQEMALGYEKFECEKQKNNSELFYNKPLNKWSTLFSAMNSYAGADVIYSGSLNVDGDYVTGQIWIKPGFNLVYVFYLQNDDIVRYSYATYAEWPENMEGYYHRMESGWESVNDAIWGDLPFESNVDSLYSDKPIYYLEKLHSLGVSPQYAAGLCNTTPQFVQPIGLKQIPAGIFTMGDSLSPEHTVTLSSFWIDSTEVCQASYVRIMGLNPSYFVSDTLNPADSLTWFDAVLYCNAKSKIEGRDTVYSFTSVTGVPGNGCTDLGNLFIDYSKKGYRLPTEAEWEYCYRAGTTTVWYWSAGWDQLLANSYSWNSNNSAGTTHPVANKISNLFGLYDMSGNVWEWCNDWYDAYSGMAENEPKGPNSSPASHRILRGGSHRYNQTNIGAARRGSNLPGYRSSNIGFRVVCHP